MPRKKKLKLKVLFDTNAIWNSSAHELMRKEVVDLIANHQRHSDIDIIWYIPEIVLKERTFQMNKEGVKSLPSVQKLEKLLNLNINKDIIQQSVNVTVNKQVESNSLQVIKIDTSKVNWESIINNALNRHPPFEDNEKEKGFRDALVLECLRQVIAKSPKNKNICRIALVTDDNLLHEAASQITSNSYHVHLFKKNDELISLINILASEKAEDLINSIKAQAGDLFFKVDDTATFLFKKKIMERIKETFQDELNILIDDSTIRENGTWVIGSPGFEKKVRQRITWKTIIVVQFEMFKMVHTQENLNYYDFSPPPIPGYTRAADSFIRPPIDSSFGLTTPAAWDIYGTHITPPLMSGSTYSTRREKVCDGKSMFEVIWSVTLTTRKKLINPTLETINYLDTVKN